MRRADNQVRVTAQLIDAIVDHHLFYLQGIESLWHAYYETKKEVNARARQMFEKAIELDSQYAGAYAGLCATYWLDWYFQWNADRAQSLERASNLAQKAIALDDSSSLPHRTLGLVHVWKKQHEQAITEAERAVALDPNDADGYMILGNILSCAGRLEEGIGLTERAMRLNPRHPPVYLLNLGFAYRMAGRYEEALVPLKKVLPLIPNSVTAHVHLAVCYAELGWLEEARAEVAAFQRLAPIFSLEMFKPFLSYKDSADVERFLAALRKAGLK